MQQFLSHFFLFCLLIAQIGFATEKRKDFTDLSQVCFLNNTQDFGFYSLHTSTVFIINDGSPSIDFIYAIQKQTDRSNFLNTHTIVEFDNQSAAIKINNEAYSPKRHDLNKIISCDFISSMGKKGGEYTQQILAKHYGIDLELITDEKTNALLESKTNTQSAIDNLYKKYANNQNMLASLNKYLTHGGLIENEGDLISALKKMQHQGIVIKLPDSIAGSAVFIISPKEITDILQMHNAKMPIEHCLSSIKSSYKIIKHLKAQVNIAWQEYIPRHLYTAEIGLQYNLNQDLTPFYATYSVVTPPFELIDHYNQGTTESSLKALSSKEQALFHQILGELLDEKAKLMTGEIYGIFDKNLRIRSFDASSFMMRDTKTTHPKVYELNMRLSSTASLIEAAHNDKHILNNQEGHLWPMTPYIKIPKGVSNNKLTEAITTTLKHFRQLHPKIFIDIGRIIYSNNLTHLRVYLMVRPVPQGQNDFWQKESERFAFLLDQTIHQASP
ncbi:MAG: hypothetical protein OXE99_09015 [Cellvibrionales bacterium]|nr:hypothetical protein [Cellvibrionales bacterium]